jgi:hypothetical protein
VKPDKSPDTPRDRVRIVMLIFRIPEVTSDIVASINVPIKTGTESTEIALVWAAQF